MKKLNGTVTLSILEEDNKQRVIFRIIPLCTKDGYIFQSRKTQYPDFGSLRIVPDKREQSSFKERMRSIGSLCCVQLLSEGKELTKVRQNRNYDPNQGEYNQYAIYSDVICGFEQEAIFEVFQENEDYSLALTETVLLQRGMVLYGPVDKTATPQWDMLRPFGNEKYLLHTVEGINEENHTFYWNPEAIVNWRQRKKALKRDTEDPQNVQPTPSPNQAIVPETEVAPIQEKEQVSSAKAEIEAIPIGTKLEFLDTQLTNDEQISELNQPVSNQANLLEHNDKPRPAEVPTEAPQFHGTPISSAHNGDELKKQTESTMHGVIDKQLKERKSDQNNGKTESTPLQSPIERLRAALQDISQMPSLHQEFLKVFSENKGMVQAIAQSSVMENQAKSAYAAAKAELDEIEGKRISLLVELDKVKTNYDQIKAKMLTELSEKKQDELAALENQVETLQEERAALEEILSQLGDQVKDATLEHLADKLTALMSSNGSDITISPTIGLHYEKKAIVETLRASMSSLGFMCKQDCVTEFMILFSQFDEICMLAETLWEGELYIKNMLQGCGLLNVTAWPSVFGTLHIASFLPENNLRTPTVEVIKNNRTPLRAYGHKVFRLIDRSRLKEFEHLPVFRVPAYNKERGVEDLHQCGKPISLQSIHSFGDKADLLYKDNEAWFAKLEKELEDKGVPVPQETIHTMRSFARITTPQVIGGFMEAVDAATLFWVVPRLINQKFPKEQLIELIGDLPRCMYVMENETY